MTEQIGRYKIEEELGSGGMAKVYIAYDPNVKRRVALKVMSGQLVEQEEYRARFQREAEAVAALEHVGIVPIYDFGEEEEKLYIVMRLMGGGDLSERIDKSPIEVHEAVGIIRRIGLALDKAHENGIIHRDLKPGNILFDDDGEAYIADFGVAHLSGASETLTGTGALIGTPAYMSPEQVRGANEEVDGRADIYSLGVILFEMLTGTAPYSADTPIGVALMHLNDPVPRVIDSNPNLAPSIQQIIDKAMAKDPDERFSTAREFADALDLAISEAHAPTMPMERPGKKEAKGKPALPVWGWVVSGIAVLALLAWALSGGLSGGSGDAQAATQTALALAQASTATEPSAPSETPEVVETEAPILEPTPVPDLVTVPLTSGMLSQVSQLVRFGQGTINDVAASPTDDLLAVVGSLGLWLYDLENLELQRQIESEGVVVNAVAWSPDGERVALGGEDGQFHVVDAADGSELLNVNAHAEPILSIAWSPDGASIATAGTDNVVHLWDALSGGRQNTLQGHTTDIYDLAWSPDGSAFVSAGWTVFYWDLERNISIFELGGHSNQINSVAWAPDGSQFVSASSDASMRVWNAAEGTLRAPLAGQEEPVFSVAWSPDGEQIVQSSGATVRVLDAASGQVLRVLDGHTGTVNNVSWTAGGSRIVSTSTTGEIRVWEPESGPLFQSGLNHVNQQLAVALSPDGQKMASGSLDGVVRLWDTASGEIISANFNHAGAVNRMAWSPDGSSFASAGADGTARVWDAETGDELRVLRGHTDALTDIAFSPDGLFIATSSLDTSVRIYDAATGGEVQFMGQSTANYSVTWSPDSTMVAYGSGDDVWIRNAESGLVVTQLSGHSADVRAVAWSPDGSLIVSGSDDHGLRIWRAASGREAMSPLLGHRGAVTAVVWSPDGSLIFSSSADGSVKVWDGVSGSEFQTYTGHTGAVSALAVTEDRFATAGLDGTLRLWGQISAE